MKSETVRRLARRGARGARLSLLSLSGRGADRGRRSADWRWRASASQARREHGQWLPLTPPTVVVARLNPVDAVPAAVPDAPVLKGLAVSAGLAEGTARVVLRSDQESRRWG